MSRGLPCLLIVITAGLLHFGPAAKAQEPQAPPTLVAPIERGEATIHGRVTDRDSNRPLIAATVQLLSADLRRSSISRTGVDGGFSFDAIAPGDYRLVVMHADYLVLGLMPTGIISGRVVTDDESPVPAGLRVAAVLADDGKEIDLLLRDTVSIGSGGAFELRGMFGARVLRVVGDTQGWAVHRVVVGKRQAATVEVQPGMTVADVQIIVTRWRSPRARRTERVSSPMTPVTTELSQP